MANKSLGVEMILVLLLLYKSLMIVAAVEENKDLDKNGNDI